MNKVINPSYSVDNLNFSMSEPEIKTILGEPTTIDNIEENHLVYYYQDLGLGIIFCVVDNQMIINSFEIEKVGYTLWGENIMNFSYDEIINLLVKKGLDYWLDNYYSDRYIFCHNIAFEFEKEFISLLTVYNPKLVK